MSAAEKIWKEHAESGDMSLIERWNYHNELGAQFRIPKLRVVYAASGTIPAACILKAKSADEPDRSVIEHKLYWAPSADQSEARYLLAIFNSETARAGVAAYQSRGQWGARDFDKVMFNLPIPRFDEKQTLHSDLAEAAKEAEKIAAQVALPENVKFQRGRKLIRDALASAGISQRIDKLVAQLLDQKTAS
jgi:hypothetical protein